MRSAVRVCFSVSGEVLHGPQSWVSSCLLWSVCCVHIWTTEPTPCTCKARTPVTLHAVIVISLLGPVAHACHSHECSLRFFVMPVHRTYTSIRGTHASESLASGIGCSVIASFLFFSFLLFFSFYSANYFPPRVWRLVAVCFLSSDCHNSLFSVSYSTFDYTPMAY